MRLSDLCDKFLKLNRKIRSPRTADHYRRAIRQYAEAISLGDATAHDLSDDGLVALEKYLIDLDYSITTVNERLGRVKALWKWLAQRGELKVWPTIARIPEPEPYRRAWTVEQVRQILQACKRMDYTYDGVPASHWWRVWHYVQWETGERTGALLRLQWTWINERGIDVPAMARKGMKSAYYRLSAHSLRELEAIRAPRREIVFPWDLHPCMFWEHYSRLLRYAGLPDDRKCKPQRMRRTHLTYWAVGGEDATLRAKHVDSETTRKHYLDETILGGIDPATVLPKL